MVQGKIGVIFLIFFLVAVVGIFALSRGTKAKYSIEMISIHGRMAAIKARNCCFRFQRRDWRDTEPKKTKNTVTVCRSIDLGTPTAHRPPRNISPEGWRKQVTYIPMASSRGGGGVMGMGLMTATEHIVLVLGLFLVCRTEFVHKI